MRVGIGYDVHRLVENRKLILGGVEIHHEKGLLGHSDADVLVHSIMDALLGALGKGDIGRHFPDSDDAYKGISSLELLEKVMDLVEREYYIVNIDNVIMAERPKIAPYIGEMKKTLSRILKLEEERINIKGTTTEKLGFVGREEGIASESIVLLDNK
ncbi:2-C-methyl-D-erythritol 2,4-cyclodiphosphate synthase [Dethiosulfatibacter aminovorans DSM 17477]|uniref:2-C-methyl-D-erythritol 2,4-cyclodiphosphate synthase n=2 Tax=Dethiosulfatibacter TaxID=448125 RepID=A0A1M6FRE5_9FIRM|nr:2-C-methyl-D-erythritol 2,4-cyclodiphosphate synthase [Dethiosulfatibacter aminovorans DSM 17477]